MKRSSNRTQSARLQRTKLLRFLEELSWVLRAHQDVDLRKLPELLKEAEFGTFDPQSGIGGYVSPNPNIHFLVGVLPAILDDERLFSSNEDIARFAMEVLGVRVARWQKKSKYEIIGHVICAVYKANDRKLSRVVAALGRVLSGDEEAAYLLEKTRAHHMNWNELIQILSRNPR